MSKFFKNICGVLIVCLGLVTCSGCFNTGFPEPAKKKGVVELATAPGNITYRNMDENLYLGYLGAQRDFVLLIDNMQYNYDHNIGSCKDDESVGCASIMAQSLIQSGIKEADFDDKTASDKNALIYYTTSKDFFGWGNPDNTDSFLKYVSPASSIKSTVGVEQSGIKQDDNVLKNLCYSNKNKSKVCGYAYEMNSKGYSDIAGNAMMLFFHKGDLVDLITDNSLDPFYELNNTAKVATTSDNIVYNSREDLYVKYYAKMVKAVVSKTQISSSTLDKSTTPQKQQIKEVKGVSQLIDLIEGKGKFANTDDDFLLMINSEGFIFDKVGTEYFYPNPTEAKKTDGKLTNDAAGLGPGEKFDESMKEAVLLMNTITTYEDNCAVENSELLNFLKSVLNALIGGAVGATAGAIVGCALGTVVPGIGNIIGAAVGGVLGFFAGIATEQAVENMLRDSNGITGKKYCKIMTSALNDIEINVPIYSYTISSFYDYDTGVNREKHEGNITKYRKNTLDPILRKYYDDNSYYCFTQNAKVGLNNSPLSFFTPNFSEEYNFADKCEVDLVRKYVGQLKGSPDLLLFQNRHRIDSLHGRVTTPLIREIVFSWGLTQIGYIYNLLTTNTLSYMGSIVGAAQGMTSLTYCLSYSPKPGCGGSGKPIVDENYINGNYIAAMDPADGIQLNFTEEYKKASIDYVNVHKSEYDELYIVMDENLDTQDESDSFYYYIKENDKQNWDKKYFEDYSSYRISTKDLENKIKDMINNGNWLKYSYTGVDGQKRIYLIDGDNVVGYHINTKGDRKNIIIDYYNDVDTKTEYIFSNQEISNKIANDNYLTSVVRENPADVKIAPALTGIYIYVEYTANDGEQGIYTYAF